jgi:four helix bundle protein
MQDFRRLRAWHVGQALALRLARSFSPGANYRVPGLRTQLVRAAVSVPANIAEGCAKKSQVEFRRYLETSLGSLMEVESDLELAHAANVVYQGGYVELIRKCAVLRRMLLSLIAHVEARIADDKRKMEGE